MLYLFTVLRYIDGRDWQSSQSSIYEHIEWRFLTARVIKMGATDGTLKYDFSTKPVKCIFKKACGYNHNKRTIPECLLEIWQQWLSDIGIGQIGTPSLESSGCSILIVFLQIPKRMMHINHEHTVFVVLGAPSFVQINNCYKNSALHKLS